MRKAGRELVSLNIGEALAAQGGLGNFGEAGLKGAMYRWLTPLCLIAASAPTAQEQALRELHALDVRIATLTDRLAVSGASLCPRKVRRWPLVLEDAALYPKGERQVATALYSLGNYPVITSPESLAGFAVTAIDGRPLGAANPRAPHDRIDQIESAVERGADLTMVKAGISRRVTPPGQMGCPSRSQVLPSTKRIARADGQIVQISTSVIAATANDHELAFILAHEMAHNILGHQAMLDRTGRKAINVRSTEIDADRLGLRLMKSAGFDPRSAAPFWARYGRGLSEGIFSDGTHMRGKERVAFLTEEAAKLAQ